MRTTILLATILMGCNYYGPENPPPDPAFPVYTQRQFDVVSGLPVDAVECPSGSLLMGGGCSCLRCSSTGVLFACQAAGTGYVGGCTSGCIDVSVICMSTSQSGTLRQGVQELSPEIQSKMVEFRGYLEDRQ